MKQTALRGQHARAARSSTRRRWRRRSMPDSIAGAALDVMTSEPPGELAAHRQRENVIITPHTSFYSEESLVELQTKASQEVVRTC